MSKESQTFVSHQPVIYKLKTNRHYGMLRHLPNEDIQWHKKKNAVIFRGAITGTVEVADYVGKINQLDDEVSHDPDTLAETKCLMIDRCRLVYRNANISFVDAKLVPRRVQNEIPRTIHHINMFSSYMSRRKLLKFKAIIMLEGNGKL
jgi:hypothetical protein